LNWKNSI